MAKEANFAWLSANLVERESGRTIFQPYLSRELAGVRVALVGLTGEQAQTAGLLGDQAEIRSWRQVLPPLMAELVRTHAFIVLLTDLSTADCLEIVRQEPRINLIVNSSGENLNQPPRLLAPRTIIAATDKQGRKIGALEIFWTPAGEWSTGDNYHLRLQAKQTDLERARRTIEELRGRPGMDSRVGNLERRVEVLLTEIADLLGKRQEPPVSFFANTFYTMAREVTDDRAVSAVVEETKAAVAGLAVKKAAKSAAAETFRPPGFSGWPTCAGCHPRVAARWQATGHALAYSALARKNRQFDFDCLPCHVTGITPANIDRVLTLAPDLRDVSCESCHGPGRQHAENPAVQLPATTENTCRLCHVPEHDDNFTFAEDVRKIGCLPGR
jgi:hypothetical protein